MPLMALDYCSPELQGVLARAIVPGCVHVQVLGLRAFRGAYIPSTFRILKVLVHPASSLYQPHVHLNVEFPERHRHLGKATKAKALNPTSLYMPVGPMVSVNVSPVEHPGRTLTHPPSEIDTLRVDVVYGCIWHILGARGNSL